MSNEFKPFMTRQTEDGQWECYHHAVNELTATGDTEAEAQSKVLTMCETVIGVNHTNLERWYDRAKAAEATLEKARAVLAEHSEALEDANGFCAGRRRLGSEEVASICDTLTEIADALGGVSMSSLDEAQKHLKLCFDAIQEFKEQRDSKPADFSTAIKLGLLRGKFKELRAILAPAIEAAREREAERKAALPLGSNDKPPMNDAALLSAGEILEGE